MAEGMTRELLARAGADVDVSSTGVIGWQGKRATDEAVEAAGERGFDISPHRARRLEAAQIQDADLVVCMTGEHAERVQEMVPEAASRTFTLKELARLLEELPPADSSTPLADRVRAADDLRRSGFEGSPYDEDVADPIGMGLEIYRASAWDIEEWATRLVTGLVGRITAREEAL